MVVRMGRCTYSLYRGIDMDDFDCYETGPFCRHWSDPSDCEEVCSNCGHGCMDHDFESGECMECECKEWTEV